MSEQHTDEHGEATDDGQARGRRPPLLFAMVDAGIWNNRKIRRAGALGALVYIFALTRNVARGRTGSFPASDVDPWYLADQLRIDEQEASQALQRTIEAGLLALEGDTAFVVGWDDTWKRQALTKTESEARHQRRLKAQQTESETKNQKQTKSRERSQTQSKSKSSPDFARTMSGHRVSEPLSPPLSEEEKRNADRIVTTIGVYTGVSYRTREELEHLARLARKGHRWPDLEALAAYTCDAGGADWASKLDKNGHPYMRPHCTVHGIFTEKNIRQNLTTAISPDAWLPRAWRRAS